MSGGDATIGTPTHRRLLAWLLPASTLALAVGALPLVLVSRGHGSPCSHSCPSTSPPAVPVRAVLTVEPGGTWLARVEVTVPPGVLVGPLAFAVYDGHGRRLFVHPAGQCLRPGSLAETFTVPRLPGVAGQRYLAADYGVGRDLRDCSEIESSTEQELARL